MHKLKLEVFESTSSIEPISFYVYKIVPKEQPLSIQQFMRSVAGKISYRLSIPAFTDDRKIYTLAEINNVDVDNSFTIKFENQQVLPVNENRGIYADLADYYIRENLKLAKFAEKYNKYKIANNITSACIYEIKKTLASNDNQFRLRREYNYKIEISEDNKLLLWLNIRSEFETKKTIYDAIYENKDVLGLKVVNTWGKFGETGVVTAIGPETVVQDLPNFKSLKQYMIDTKQEKRIVGCNDNSPVVHVKMSNGKDICYYPQALKPIVTLERISNENPSFSKLIEKYTKLDMKTRQKIAQDFIQDIGQLKGLGNVSFNLEYIDTGKIGFSEKNIIPPKIICGNNTKIDYNKLSFIFGNGFYKQPINPVKFAYFYPKGQEQLMRNFAIALTDFLQKGSLFGDSKYLSKNLMLSELKAVCAQEYEIGDTTNYKKLVRTVSEQYSFDVAIVLVPTLEDESNPYSTFKTSWAEKNIPSQMISVKTAQLFENKDKNAIWSMHNIALGIFAKSGGIPWIVDEVPGNIDCFVGIDVATLEKGIHYPTCATVFDKNGRPISFYKPKKAQKGEKINQDILQEIFDEIILGYEESTRVKLKNLVIHRDGFSNEDADWYKNYFEKKEINYSVIEVKKFFSSKLLREENGIAKNPQCGDCLANETEAFIVTTDIKDGKSSPRPLHIKKQVGTLSMEIILQQILALSCMHFGATKKSRLPVTTFYADKICKNIDYVPEGKFGNRLFFL